MATAPLLLADMLEQETVRLRGASRTTLRRRFTLHPREIRDARALARQLASRLAAEDAPAIHDWMRRGNDPDYAAAIGPEIDALLSAKRWLFDHPEFADLKRAPYDRLGDLEDYASADEVFNLNRRMFDDLFQDEVMSAAESRLGDAVASIHDGAKTAPRTGLAISGGGIRSATFALGVLQGLARRRLLQDFDFVSTVSSGGYVGSWLSSWSRRDPWGIRGVAGVLASKPWRRLNPEPAPIGHLRAFSNYLRPKLGGLSADTWSLIASYLRNLVINWLVLVPLLAVVVLLPRLLICGLRNPPAGPAAAVAGAAGALILSLVMRNLVIARPISDWRKRRKFTDDKFVRQCLLPLLVACVLFLLAWAWYAQPGAKLSLRLVVGTTTALWMAAFGFFLYELRSEAAVERRIEDAETRRRRALRIIGELTGSVLAGLVGGVLVWLAANAFPSPLAPLDGVSVERFTSDSPPPLIPDTVAYSILGVPILLGIFFLQTAVFVGIAGKTSHDFDREWWQRASGWVLAAALVWFALAGITVYGPVAVGYAPMAVQAAGGVVAVAAGAVSLLAGWSSKRKESSSAASSSRGKRSLGIVGVLAGPLFIIFFLAGLSIAISWILGRRIPPVATVDQVEQQAGRQVQPSDMIPDKMVKVKDKLIFERQERPIVDLPRWRAYQQLRMLYETNPNDLLLVYLTCLGLAMVASTFVGVNIFSMHAFYRNRLVRACLGASRWVREPNAFTGFDPADNLSMHDLRPEYVWSFSFRDLPAVAARLRGQSTTALKTLADVWGAKLGSVALRVLDAAEKGKVDPTFYLAANEVIATADLLPGYPPQEVFRPLRNRRFIELAFGDDVYPSPMPLLCVQDLLDHEGFAAAFAESSAKPLESRFKRLQGRRAHAGPLTLGELLEELNDVIATADLAADPAFAALAIDTSPFAVVDAATLAKVFGDGARVVHRMIDNRLRLERAIPGAIAPLRPAKGFHLVDLCLNLTGGEQLARQERKGESFTVSPFAAGSHRLGYRDARDYASISLGTAVTISGAAASPAWGYQSSPALAFLMTLFNLRLGWWLGNPGLAGQTTYRLRNPRMSLLPLISEAVGQANDKFAYIYLSDGGHFENLGIYELVLRRCHCIVISDAGYDFTSAYGDLAEVVRKVRVDLGIPIQITHIGTIPSDEKKPGNYCAVGVIDYSFVDGPDAAPGRLLYVKPVVDGDDEGLPRDVFNDLETSYDFTDGSTAEQRARDSQFERYRRLGDLVIDQICASAEDPQQVRSIESLIEAAVRGLTPRKRRRSRK